MKFYYKSEPSEFWGFQNAKGLDDAYEKIIEFNPKIKDEETLHISKVDSRRIHVYSPSACK